MRRISAISAVAFAAFIGCAQNQVPPERPTGVVEASQQDTIDAVFAIGSEIASNGEIVDKGEEKSYLKGNDVFVSVDVASASAASTVGVVWQDAQGRPIAQQRRQVTPEVDRVWFKKSTTPLSKGNYTAVVVINDRAVSEHPFEVL